MRGGRDERDSYRRSEMEFGVAADAYRSDPSRKATRNGAVMVTVILALAAFLAVLGAWYALTGRLSLAAIAVALVVGLAVLSSVHVCLEWERAVIMRLGRFSRLAGPGIFFSIPLIEFCTLRVDQRTIATPFGAEEALTSDLVPLDVDAVLFWMIWDPEKACTEVEDCRFAVALTAQTALRDAIGRASVSNVVMRRPQQDVSRETSCRHTASRLPPSDPGSLLLRTLPHAPAFQPLSRPYGPVCIVSNVSSYDWPSNGFSKLLNALFFIGTTNYYGKI